jgi:hypothetical protein
MHDRPFRQISYTHTVHLAAHQGHFRHDSQEPIPADDRRRLQRLGPRPSDGAGRRSLAKTKALLLMA